MNRREEKSLYEYKIRKRSERKRERDKTFKNETHSNPDGTPPPLTHIFLIEYFINVPFFSPCRIWRMNGMFSV